MPWYSHRAMSRLVLTTLLIWTPKAYGGGQAILNARPKPSQSQIGQQQYPQQSKQLELANPAIMGGQQPPQSLPPVVQNQLYGGSKTPGKSQKAAPPFTNAGQGLRTANNNRIGQQSVVPQGNRLPNGLVQASKTGVFIPGQKPSATLNAIQMANRPILNRPPNLPPIKSQPVIAGTQVNAGGQLVLRGGTCRVNTRALPHPQLPGLAMSCTETRGCQFGYACIPSLEDPISLYVCCQPNPRQRSMMNLPTCPVAHVPYFPYGTVFPRQCNNRSECPPAFDCQVSVTTTSVKLCCLNIQGPSTPDGQPVAPVQPGTGIPQPLGGAASECPYGLTAAPAAGGQGTTQCTLGNAGTCPTGHICTATTGSPVCCPHVDVCEHSSWPFAENGQVVPKQCQQGVTGTCPDGFICNEVSAGHWVCCPNFGHCAYGLMPYIQPGQPYPMDCEFGTDEYCPPSYSCVISDTQMSICCPNFGACPDGSPPYIQANYSTPQVCSLNGGAECLAGYSCQTSTSGWGLCCQGLGAGPGQQPGQGIAAGTQPAQPGPSQPQVPGLGGVQPANVQAPGDVVQPAQPVQGVSNQPAQPAQPGAVSGVCAASMHNAVLQSAQGAAVTCATLSAECTPNVARHHCESGTDGRLYCCPDIKTCPGEVNRPAVDANNKIIICPSLADTTSCPPSFACQETLGGFVTCCPDLGKCPDGSAPYFESGKATPNKCTVAGVTVAPVAGDLLSVAPQAQCPSAIREYECRLSAAGNEGLCCSVAGACPPGKMPLIIEPANRPTVCPSGNECPTDAECLESTTPGTRICCIDVDKGRKLRQRSLLPQAAATNRWPTLQLPTNVRGGVIRIQSGRAANLCAAGRSAASNR